MPLLATPFTADGDFPDQTEVLIIGGGIIGVSAALTLIERGIPVTLCEKGEIAGEQSSRNWGWCRQQGRDPRELPLIVESLRRWSEMNERVGEDTGFRRCGTLYLAENEDDLEKKALWLDFAAPFPIDAQVISAAKTKTHLNSSIRDWAGALYCASDGRAEPFSAVPAMARAAQRQGAKIFTNTAVHSLITSSGSVSGAITEKGEIKSRAVLLAAGAWSRYFCADEQLTLPQLRTRSSVLRTGRLDNGPNACISAPRYSIRKRADGGYTVAAGAKSRIDFDITPDAFRFLPLFSKLAWMVRSHLHLRLGERFKEEWRDASKNPGERYATNRMLDPAPINSSLDSAFQALQDDFPGFQSVPIEQRWAGMIDVTPDAVPVISPVPSRPGLVIATGFSGHGFGIGPAAGELAADLIANSDPMVDPNPFRFSRFSDGSTIEPIVGI